MTVILISLAVAFVFSPTPQKYNGPHENLVTAVLKF